MKFGHALLIFAALTWGTSAPAESSISPSGRFKITSIPVKDPSSGLECYALDLYDLSTKKAPRRIKDAGYFKNRQKLEDVVLWHPKEDLFALVFPDGRKFSCLRICYLSKGNLKDLEMPDYIMNAVGRVQALRTYNTCYLSHGAWSGDTLGFDLEFNVRDKPEEFGLYKAKVKLLVNDPSGKPWVSLSKVSIVEEFRPGE